MLAGGGATSIRDQSGPYFGRTYPYLNCGGAGPVAEAARGLSGRNLDACHVRHDKRGKGVVTVNGKSTNHRPDAGSAAEPERGKGRRRALLSSFSGPALLPGSPYLVLSYYILALIRHTTY